MIRVENLHISAGTFSLKGISFEIPTGCYGMLMGKTGSGKTTILEAIAGLRPISGGQIILDGKDVTRLRPAERNIGLVPQDGALFTTMSVQRQLAFALDVRNVPKRESEETVMRLAERLEIGHLLKRSVAGLSGGEQQRVALGRALAFGPRVLCLDEPLSALDQETRGQIMRLLKRVQQESGVTCLHVTHSEMEADAMGDVRIAIQDNQVLVSANGKSRTSSNHTQGPTSESS